jgi:hypothetical protein
MLKCTKARALWEEMRHHWSLPEEVKTKCTGPEFLLLLAQLDKDQKQNILLLMWRIWHLRNDVIFGKGNEAIAGRLLSS